MSTVPVSDSPLRQELELPHDTARAVLEDPEGNPLVAVAWCSTHLAAVARVLHPAARHGRPHVQDRLHELLAADHALQQALWSLDRRLTGDARVSGLELDRVRLDVLHALDAHVRREHAFLDVLLPQLSAQDQGSLAERLADAVRRAPTRPHPDSPHHGALGLLAFGVDAGVDHVRDLLDSRSWPTPHDQRAARAPGRWGSYLLGVPPARRPDEHGADERGGDERGADEQPPGGRG